MVNATLRPLYRLERGPVPIVQEAGWAQGRSGWVRKVLSSLGFDPRIVQPVAIRYTDYAIPAHDLLSITPIKIND